VLVDSAQLPSIMLEHSVAVSIWRTAKVALTGTILRGFEPLNPYNYWLSEFFTR